MFTATQTAILEYMLKHPVVSTGEPPSGFDNMPNFYDDFYSLQELGVVEWFENSRIEGYRVNPKWSKLLTKHFNTRDELARIDAEKKKAQEINRAKSERFKIIYSVVVSVIIAVIIISITMIRKGMPLFSVGSLSLLIGTAIFSLTVAFPIVMTLTALPTMFGCAPDAAPAMPSLVIGVVSLATAIIMALFR